MEKLVNVALTDAVDVTEAEGSLVMDPVGVTVELLVADELGDPDLVLVALAGLVGVIDRVGVTVLVPV